MKEILAYVNHFFLNLGAAINCIFYAAVPPRVTGHTEEDIKHLAGYNPVKAFVVGLFDLDE